MTTKQITSKIQVKMRSKSKSAKKNSKSKAQEPKIMRGGDDGRYVMPGAYFGNGTKGYYGEGSNELSSSGNQKAVSRGSIWKTGDYTGPNLYPMGGGDYGCKKRKSKKLSKLSKPKSKLLKSKKNKTAIKSQNGGFLSSFFNY